MKQSLQLRIGQSLTMTPQLQQAIKLLQLSSLELQTEIQATLDANPLLEQDDNLGEITVIDVDANR
jgi:RNA polymerase sigma-54 factor